MARWNDQSTLRHQIKFIEILWIFQGFFFPPPQKIGFSMFFLLTIFHGYFLLGKWTSISTQRRRDVNLLRTRAWRSSPRERRENRGRMDVCMGKKKTTFKWMGRYIYICVCVCVATHSVYIKRKYNEILLILCSKDSSGEPMLANKHAFTHSLKTSRQTRLILSVKIWPINKAIAMTKNTNKFLQ